MSLLRTYNERLVEPGFAVGADDAERSAAGRVRAFRPIHYLGSKLRALEPIIGELNRLDPGRGPVCDLFSGSGTVAYAASQSRPVIAVDIQRYSAVLCEALLGRGHHPTGAEVQKAVANSPVLRALSSCCSDLLGFEQSALDEATRGNLEPISMVMEEGALVRLDYHQEAASLLLRRAQEKSAAKLRRAGLNPVCLRHYGGAFFSYRQALVLDTVSWLARGESSKYRSLLAPLLTAASELVNTVGKQFAQPLRLRSKSGQIKRHLQRKIVVDRSKDALECVVGVVEEYRRLPKGEYDSRVLCEDYRTALRRMRGEISLVYADPPYTRDHYSRYYHVLETLAIGDDPDISMSNLGGGKKLSRGVYRADRHQSDFCIRSRAHLAFRTLFEETFELGVPLLLSYSVFDHAENAHPRVLSLRDLKELAETVYPWVDVSTINLEYSKLNHTSLHKGAEGTKEVLISCALKQR